MLKSHILGYLGENYSNPISWIEVHSLHASALAAIRWISWASRIGFLPSTPPLSISWYVFIGGTNYMLVYYITACSMLVPAKCWTLSNLGWCWLRFWSSYGSWRMDWSRVKGMSWGKNVEIGGLNYIAKYLHRWKRCKESTEVTECHV